MTFVERDDTINDLKHGTSPIVTAQGRNEGTESNRKQPDKSVPQINNILVPSD